MKLHETLVQKLIQIIEINSGWKEERKLKEALRNLDVTTYTRADGKQVLVDTTQMNQELKNLG